MTEISVSSYALTLEHKKITSSKPFVETVAALERRVPHVDDGIWKRLDDGDIDSVKKQLEDGPTLLIFLKRDHGSTDQMIDFGRNCLQYEIGNPLTASKMTSKVMAAGLYAPLRIVLYENEAGGSTFEYDLPSTQFDQYGDPDIAAIGDELDAELERALTSAAT